MPEISTDELVTRTHDHLNQYIALADNKASILVTAHLAFLGLFANALNNLSIESPVVWWSALLSAAFGVVGVFLAGWVVYPRTPKPKTGVLFWENIVEFDSRKKFNEEIQSLENKGARNQLISENYDLAAVAHNKYNFLRWALRATGLMILLAMVASIAYLFF